MAEKRIRNLNPEEIECRVGAIMEQGITLLPVSYTHLDVYKRQGHSSGSSLNMSEKGCGDSC